jgi:hypothetical protein
MPHLNQGVGRGWSQVVLTQKVDRRIVPDGDGGYAQVFFESTRDEWERVLAASFRLSLRQLGKASRWGTEVAEESGERAV